MIVSLLNDQVGLPIAKGTVSTVMAIQYVKPDDMRIQVEQGGQMRWVGIEEYMDSRKSL